MLGKKQIPSFNGTVYPISWSFSQWFSVNKLQEWICPDNAWKTAIDCLLSNIQKTSLDFLTNYLKAHSTRLYTFVNLSLYNLFNEPTAFTKFTSTTCFYLFYFLQIIILNFSFEISFLSYLILLYFYFPFETCLCLSLCWFCEMLDRRLYAWELCRFKLF